MRKLAVLLICWIGLTGAASTSFDGANDDVQMGDVLDVSTGNVSVCAWAKMTEDAGGDFILSKRSNTGAGDEGYVLRQVSDDQADFTVNDGSASYSSRLTDIDGAWYGMIGTWDATDEITELFLNGASVDSDDHTGVGSITSTGTVLAFGEGNGANEDVTGLIAYGAVFKDSDFTVKEALVFQFYPCLAASNFEADGFWPLWGADATEFDRAAGSTGTISNATTSADGPPVALWASMRGAK